MFHIELTPREKGLLETIVNEFIGDRRARAVTAWSEGTRSGAFSVEAVRAERLFDKIAEAAFEPVAPEAA